MAKVRTRIAPSPTGNLHVGTARAALYNELFARQHEGQFIVRVEDTDKERSKPEFEANILEGMQWLGLTWDEGPDVGGDYGPYRQSERGEHYSAAITQLLSEEKAYEDDGAIKLRVSQEEVTFEDLIRGKVSTPTDSWGGDFVIARSETDPVFHLAVVVDDAAMQISHVIRGEDHVSNTARHILLQQALGLPTPQYAHLPLLLDEQRKKLSKRAGDVELLQYRDAGYLPEALLNYLALLGWNPGNDEELFSHEALIKAFALEKVQKGGAIFSEEKLTSMNKHYIRQLSALELYEQARPFLDAAGITSAAYWTAALQTEQERVGTLAEFAEALEFYQPDWPGDYEPAILIWKKSDAATTKELLQKTFEFLSELPESDFNDEVLEEKLISWIDEHDLGRGDTLWPLRVALTGREQSPSPFEVAAVLGKETTLQRITSATEKLD